MTTATTSTAHLIGDSTLANKCTLNGNPERGWGQLLPSCFIPGFQIANHALDGRSTKSFIDEGHWERVFNALRPGDWIVIQFGHNDQKHDQPLRYTHASTTYSENLGRFAREARAQGAHPLFATSIYRRRFTPDGSPENSLGDYPEAMRHLAASIGVPLIDLHTHTRDLLRSLGPEKSKALFLHFAPGDHPFYPQGKADDTHLSAYGARTISTLFTRELRRLDLELARWLLPDQACHSSQSKS
jgi:lysophospholipase L1-like esterase